MSDGTVFPAFLQLRHEPDGSARASLLREVDSALGDVETRFRSFSAEARRQLDQAMSTRRNSFGSLDLGVDQLKAAAQAQQARAIAAREVANATALAAKQEGDYGRQARLAVTATEALAREEEEAAHAALQHAAAVEQVQLQLNKTKSATDLVVQATGRGTTAQQSVINSTRASRVAFVQLGQQMTDVAVQMEMGARATTIFVQQVPQMAFALSGLADSANKTQARIGRFATFLAGPWGAAIFAASAILGPFVFKLLESGDAADESERKHRSLTQVLNDQSSSYKEVIEALDEYNRAKAQEIAATSAGLRQQAIAIQQNIDEAISIREKARAEYERIAAFSKDPTFAEGNLAYAGQLQGLDADIARQNTAIEKLKRDIQGTRGDIADILSDPEKKIRDDFALLRQYFREHITDVDELTRKYDALRQQEQAALANIRQTNKGASAAAQASLGDMVALVKQLFPGATITSTTGGRHTRGSDHYAGRAIDFVPAGGMGRYTTEEVEQILRDAGVDIRRNASGVEQMFGPGRPASRPGDHDDHFHFAWQGGAPDPEKVQAALARAQQLLREFGEKAKDSITQINDRFDEQPRLIDQAAQATDRLNEIIAELAEKKPVGFEQMISDAEKAKVTIQDALVRPFRELGEESQRRVEIDRLLLEGREKEAAVLETIWQMEERLGPLTDEQEASVRRIVEAREDELKALRRLQEEQSAYLDATRSVRSEIEAIFSGRGNIANFRQIFRDLQGKVLTQQIFGDVLEELDDSVKAQFGRAVDNLESDTERTGEALRSLAEVVDETAVRLSHAGRKGAATSFDDAFGLAGTAKSAGAAYKAGALVPTEGKPIVVSAERNSAGGMSPDAYAQMMARAVTTPIVDELSNVVGPGLARQIGGVLSGALYGYTTAGQVGGVLGGLQGIVDPFGSKIEGLLYEGLGKALGGAQTGSMISGLAGAFGIKLSGTGSQIGGALGSLIPIPGGDIIGAIAGGIIGKLFGGTKRGSAIIGGVGGDLGISGYYGNSSSRKDAAGGLAGSVLEAIDRIADQLGATVNSSAGRVSIGIRDDNYRVDPTGRGITKTKNGAIDFGQDAEAAIAFAVKNLIEDGVLTGLRQTTLNIIRGGNDLEAAIKDALDFEDVFKRLKRLKDPVGSAMDDLDSEFERLKDLFTKAGASVDEWNQLEELYWLERDQLIKDATANSLGSLKSFLTELTVGNDALSLRDRKAAALAEYTPLAQRVAAGDASAYDDFVEAARALLDIERQISGSQIGYFNRLNEVTGLTQKALDGGSGTSFADRDSPFGDRSEAMVAGINDTNTLLGDIRAGVTAFNQNMGTLIALTGTQRTAFDYGTVDGGW